MASLRTALLVRAATSIEDEIEVLGLELGILICEPPGPSDRLLVEEMVDLERKLQDAARRLIAVKNALVEPASQQLEPPDTRGTSEETVP